MGTPPHDEIVIARCQPNSMYTGMFNRAADHPRVDCNAPDYPLFCNVDKHPVRI